VIIFLIDEKFLQKLASGAGRVSITITKSVLLNTISKTGDFEIKKP